MTFSHFFIHRPIFAGVISLFIFIGGLLAMFQLPITEYPEVSPPSVVVTAAYPGANPSVVADTVASVIEQELQGTEDMIYMSSQSTGDGRMQLTVTFAIGTDIDRALQNVRSRVNRATPRLPEVVQRLGVVSQKFSPNLTMVVHLVSPDNTYDSLYMSNYANLRVKDRLSAVNGVGQIQVFGGGQFSLRVWLNPAQLAQRDLTVNHVIRALREQNRQVAAGSLGAQPDTTVDFKLLINVKGRLESVEEFNQIVVKVDDDGQITRLEDIARIELGSDNYSIRSLLNNQEAIALGVFQASDSNAIQVSNDVRATMEQLKRDFPNDLDYRIVYDPTVFVKESINSVVETLFEALLLVILVVLLFLQTWRASIIPLAAVPVSLVGTFAVMHVFGFSLNALSLFGLVLAIGIVVDDAIVVVENVERNIEDGLAPSAATIKAMNEVTGPIIATTLVLAAVFIPTAFISGLTGQFYKEFALTITISTIISSINSLTLSPALCALLLKPKNSTPDQLTWLLDRLFSSWLFSPFNRGMDRLRERYDRGVQKVIRFSVLSLVVYLGLTALTAVQFNQVPRGYIPQQDKTYLIAFTQLPDGASLDRTQAVIEQMTTIMRDHPAVDDVVAFPGLSINGFVNATNAGTLFVGLKDFEQRTDMATQLYPTVGALNQSLASINEAFVAVLPPPPIIGLGTTGGFRLQIMDEADYGPQELFKVTQAALMKAYQEPRLAGVFSSYQAQVPQLTIDVDRERAKLLGVELNDVFETLQVYLGSLYVNDFNKFGRTYQVNLQADGAFRQSPEQILDYQLKNKDGDMVPLGAFVTFSYTAGPDQVPHYNGFPTAEINGNPAPGVSSGDAQQLIIDIVESELPNGMTWKWTELTYQQELAGNTEVLIYPLIILFVFLVLAAQYESLRLPGAIILIVPMVLLSALTGVMVTQGDNNIFTQIGLMVLVGLATKNAILIVAFAKDLQTRGLSLQEAIGTACRLRLRPILMTSLAFIMGVAPLAFATGAGAEMRQAMGITVFSGMIGVTLFGLIFTPLFYYLLKRSQKGAK